MTKKVWCILLTLCVMLLASCQEPSPAVLPSVQGEESTVKQTTQETTAMPQTSGSSVFDNLRAPDVTASASQPADPSPTPSVEPAPSVEPTPSPSVSPSPSPEPSPEALVPLKLPKTGLIKSYVKGKKIAPFNVKVPKGNVNYYLKLMKEDNTLAYEFFIRGGSTLKSKVAVGKYTVKYASGENWYGPENRFGSGTAYQGSQEVFEFYKKGSRVYGYTLTLEYVQNGNFATQPIDPGSF